MKKLFWIFIIALSCPQFAMALENAGVIALQGATGLNESWHNESWHVDKNNSPELLNVAVKHNRCLAKISDELERITRDDQRKADEIEALIRHSGRDEFPISSIRNEYNDFNAMDFSNVKDKTFPIYPIEWGSINSKIGVQANYYSDSGLKITSLDFYFGVFMKKFMITVPFDDTQCDIQGTIDKIIKEWSKAVDIYKTNLREKAVTNPNAAAVQSLITEDAGVVEAK